MQNPGGDVLNTFTNPKSVFLLEKPIALAANSHHTAANDPAHLHCHTTTQTALIASHIVLQNAILAPVVAPPNVSAVIVINNGTDTY